MKKEGLKGEKRREEGGDSNGERDEGKRAKRRNEGMRGKEKMISDA